MGRIFFRGVNLIDGEHKPQPNSTVVVQGQRIKAVGKNGKVPNPTARDVVYDLGGKSLMPGMVQCHYHVAYANVGDMNDIDMKYPPTYLTLIAAKNAELLLSCGYTGAAGAGTMHNIDVTLKKAINSGMIPGPRFLACGRDVVTTGDSVDCHPSFWKMGMDGLARVCDGPDDFRKAVREEIKLGVDIIKLYPTGGHGLMWDEDTMTMSQDEIDAATTAAHERGRKIRGHIISKKGILAALKAGMDVIDHGDRMDDECIEGMLEQETFVVPSLYFPWKVVEEKRRTGSSDWGGVDSMERNLEHSYEILPKANKAGVKLVIGDDFGIAAMPHGEYACELEAYVKGAGIPANEVLRWATKNGAELLGRGDELGTIEPGKIADLLIVKGNPARDITILQDKKNLHAIMKEGEFYRNELTPSRARLQKAA